MSAPTTAPGRWTVIVPIKESAEAKSRIVGRPRALVEAIALDTIGAIRRTGGVIRVVVVTDDLAVTNGVRRLSASSGSPCTTLDGAPAGLNAAVLFAAEYVRERWGAAELAVIPGDIAGIIPAELERVLQRAARFPRAVLVDADETGTVLITARERHLLPRFGADSFREHREIGHDAIAVDGVRSVRRDIDTWDHLAGSWASSLGERTRSALAVLKAAGASPI